MTGYGRALVVVPWILAGVAQAQTATPLRPYTACTFDDGLALVEHSPLPQGVQGRTVETLTGPKAVELTRGERVVFAYPDTDFFANVKAEQLPATSFEQGLADLIGNFDHILAAGGDESERNMAFAVKPMLNGFEVHGLDRRKLEGSTLGIYLLVDRRTKIVTSVYFLNQNAARRKFSTLAEYAVLRDHFLNAYTSCVHAPYAVQARAKPTKPARPAARRKR